MPYDLGTTTHGSTVVYDSGDFPKLFDWALDRVGYAGLRDEQARARRAGRHVGIGLAYVVEKSGLGPWESARVLVDGTGRVVVHTGHSLRRAGRRDRVRAARRRRPRRALRGRDRPLRRHRRAAGQRRRLRQPRHGGGRQRGGARGRAGAREAPGRGRPRARGAPRRPRAARRRRPRARRVGSRAAAARDRARGQREPGAGGRASAGPGGARLLHPGQDDVRPRAAPGPGRGRRRDGLPAHPALRRRLRRRPGHQSDARGRPDRRAASPRASAPRCTRSSPTTTTASSRRGR